MVCVLGRGFSLETSFPWYATIHLSRANDPCALTMGCSSIRVEVIVVLMLYRYQADEECNEVTGAGSIHMTEKMKEQHGIRTKNYCASWPVATICFTC